MQKVKKTILIGLMMIGALVGKNVFADEIYYTNSQGVSFTKEQYDFYTYLTHDGFQEHITQDMLDEIANADLSTIEVKKVSICPMPENSAAERINLRRDDNLFIDTPAKSLEISSISFGGNNRIYATVEWHGEPAVKSHDVIGAYLTGTVSRLSPPATFVTAYNYCDDEEAIKYDTYGFGAVIQVPDEDDIFIDQTFLYSGTGTIFYSYQHAMSTISLQDAQLFNIGLIGYGGVFDFYGNAVGVYDEMPGVHMDV